MNIFKISLLCILMLCASGKSFGQVMVIVTNIGVLEGHMHIGIYNDPEVFLEIGEEYLISRTKVNGSEMIIPISSLDIGSYAISLFHDVDSNEEIEKNFFGIPKEPYGFSQNYKPKFRAPKFSECSFVYDGKQIEIEIILLD